MYTVYQHKNKINGKIYIGITKKKLSQNYPHKRKVYCEELDKVFDSVQQCSKELNIPATNISKLCRGRGKALKGYHLRYYDDTINA